MLECYVFIKKNNVRFYLSIFTNVFKFIVYRYKYYTLKQ